MQVADEQLDDAGGSYRCSTEIAQHMASEGHPLVSASTVCKMMRDIGYSYQTTQRELPLDDRKRAKRLAWAKKVVRVPWKNVLFTDSKIFRGSRTSLRGEKAWAPKGRPRRRPLEKFGAFKVHVYGGISMHGATSLHIVSGTTGVQSKYGLKGVGGKEYVDVLKVGGEGNNKGMVQEAAELFNYQGGGGWIWEQDMPNIHKNKGVAAHLKQVGVGMLPWASNSPDMSLIENVWSEVERVLWKGPKWTDQADFTTKLRGAWESVTGSKEFRKALWQSMRPRLRSLIEAEGGRVRW
jgi:hypothetical protein